MNSLNTAAKSPEPMVRLEITPLIEPIAWIRPQKVPSRPRKISRLRR